MSSSNPDYTPLRFYALVTLLTLGGIGFAVWLLDLVPPRHLTFAAGRPGSGYYAMAERYQTILARDGITLEIVETAGSVENAADLSRAADPVDAGFLQGGVNPPRDAAVSALAAVFLEPLWIFHLGIAGDPANPLSWQGLRIAAGEEGSGTRYVVDRVIRVLGIDPGQIDLIPLNGTAAAEALLAGEVDVALIVGPPGAPYLTPLFAEPLVSVGEIRDVEALSRRLPFAQIADIPPSGFDYAARNPSERIDLLAMTGRLAARSDLHAALVDRLINAARIVHSHRDLITRENQFPSLDAVDMPINPQAESLLSAPGPSPLHRYLPYWVVAQVNKFALLLVPLLVLLVPLFRLVPEVYEWRMRSRVYRRYLDLREIDDQATTETDPSRLRAMVGRLDEIEADLARLRLPPRFREHAYTMRMHVDLVRRKLAEHTGEI